MAKFFTSDLHLGHKGAIIHNNRPFRDVEEMNGVIVENWNTTVSPQDEVYCCGDLAMAFRFVEQITPRLNGDKYLIAGNHDYCHPAHRKSRHTDTHEKWVQHYLDVGWKEVHLEMELDIGITRVRLSHLQYLDPAEPLKHDKFRRMDDGMWLLCGHVHTEWSTRGKQINVGVDVRGYRPMPLTDVVTTIQAHHLS